MGHILGSTWVSCRLSLMSLGGHGGQQCPAEGWDAGPSWPVHPAQGSNRPGVTDPPTALWGRCFSFPDIPVLQKSTLDLRFHPGSENMLPATEACSRSPGPLLELPRW